MTARSSDRNLYFRVNNIQIFHEITSRITELWAGLPDSRKCYHGKGGYWTLYVLILIVVYILKNGHWLMTASCSNCDSGLSPFKYVSAKKKTNAIKLLNVVEWKTGLLFHHWEGINKISLRICLLRMYLASTLQRVASHEPGMEGGSGVQRRVRDQAARQRRGSIKSRIVQFSKVSSTVQYSTAQYSTVQ